MNLIKCNSCGEEIPDGPVGAWWSVKVHECYGMESPEFDLCRPCWEKVRTIMNHVDSSN